MDDKTKNNEKTDLTEKISDTLEHIAESIPAKESIESVDAQYSNPTHDNELPGGVNDEIDLWCEEKEK